MAKHIMTVKEMADRDKWLEVRKMGIGGSDAAIIVGCNRWKSPYQLWLEKTGQIEAEDISNKEPVYWGNILEDVVAREFTARTGKKVKKCGTLQDEEFPFLLANVDRMVVGENAGLECKTANGFKAKEWEGDEIPDSYYVQCQHYMMVTGCERWYIACLIGGQRFVWKTVERNEEDIAIIKEKEIDFWNRHVQGGEMPGVDGSDDCSKALEEKFQGGSEEEATFSKEDENTIEIILNLKSSIKELEAELKEQENKIKACMGDCEVGYANEHKITWKTTAGRVSIDTKKLKAEMPEVYEKYSKMSKGYRLFKIS